MVIYFRMDYVGEVLALGIDVLILGACIKQYLKNQKAMSMIQVSHNQKKPITYP